MNIVNVYNIDNVSRLFQGSLSGRVKGRAILDETQLQFWHGAAEPTGGSPSAQHIKFQT